MSRTSPEQTARGVVSCAAGADDSYLLRADGMVCSMGVNNSGQLGDGTNLPRTSPVLVLGGTAQQPTAPAGLVASAGAEAGVAGITRLSWNPTLGAASYEVWRSSTDDFSTATLIASNVFAGVFYDRTGTVGATYYYWIEASNQAGTSAAGSPASGYSVPWIVPAITAQPADQTVNCGEHASFTIAAGGDPAPTLQWQSAPAGSPAWSDLAESEIYVGVTGATLTVNGPTYPMNGDQFRCVASNGGGQAVSQAATLTVNAVAGVISISSGSQHSLFLRADGSLWGMGYNTDGELGDGTQTNRLRPAPLARGVVAASAGANHSLVLRSDGTLWATGANTAGQLGDGTTTSSLIPVHVADNVMSASAGSFYSVFVKSDGSLWTVGSNTTGQLGDGATTFSTTPPVHVADGVVAASAGDQHCLFWKLDGTLWAMGEDSYGQLGDGGYGIQLVPEQVASGVIAAAAGGAHSLFLKSDGTLWAMGSDYLGQLGDGQAFTDVQIPEQVASGVVALAAGENHSLFVKSDGTLWAMGCNWYGQLGDGTTTNQPIPVQVASGVIAASARGNQSLFVKSDGTLWAMGSNYAGQLGDGTLTAAHGPVQVGGGLDQVWSAPTGLTASQGTVSCAVRLNWNPVVGAAGYEVWRSTTDTITGASLIAGNVPSPIFGDFTAEGGVSYFYWIRAVNLAGTSDFSVSGSGAIALIAPAVTLQPAAQSPVSGQAASFTAAASGSPGPSYQWQFSVDGGSTWSNLSDDSTDSGTATATLTVSGTTLAMRGSQYRCVVSNSVASATTQPAILTVDPALVVSTLAGTASTSGSVNGTGTAAQFNNPAGVATDRAGNLFLADSGNHTIRKVTPGGAVTTLAGAAGLSGSSDGAGSAARFYFPDDIAIDIAGNLYVTDTANGTIRKVTPAGVVSTLAGAAGSFGSADGLGSDARFNTPQGLAVDRQGNVYVADHGIPFSIRKVTPQGLVTTIPGIPAYFPSGIAVDATGNIYLTDLNGGSIFKITPAGVATRFAGGSYLNAADGRGTAAGFHLPGGLALDPAGNLYVADTGNFLVRKVTPSGVVTTVAGLAATTGTTDGTGSAARFSWPVGIAVDRAGTIYVADTQNSTLRKGVLEGIPVFSVQPADESVILGQDASFSAMASGNGMLDYQWQVSSDGGVTWNGLADGSLYAGATATTLTVSDPTVAMGGEQFRCIASDPTALSTISVAATLTVQFVPAEPTVEAGEDVISDGFVATWSSVNGATGYQLDLSTDSSFSSFASGYQGLDVGNVTNETLRGLSPNTTYYFRVRAYNSAGVGANSSTITVTTSAAIVVTTPLSVSTLAGQPLTSGNRDATGGAARFYYPSGIAADRSGNLYLADTDNHTIRKIVASTGAVTTLAGLAGDSGSSDGSGSDARFNSPSGVAVDGAGNVYVADTLNHTLRTVTPLGVVSTLAGSPGAAGNTDGTGSTALFQGPQGLAIDSASNLYVADTNNHTIRKVVPSTGAVTTVAGLAGNAGSADGPGSSARFNYPAGLAIDSAANLHVADSENHTIREISPTGLVRTLAGLAGASGGADGAGSDARFDSPAALAVDSSGNVYVADTDNFTIREVVPFDRGGDNPGRPRRDQRERGWSRLGGPVLPPRRPGSGRQQQYLHI